MSSLAELLELVGFFSYSRQDDDSHGAPSALRDRIQRGLRASSAVPGTAMSYPGLKNQQHTDALWADIAQYNANGGIK